MCGGYRIDPNHGLTVEGLLKGLQAHADDLKERREKGVDASGMTAKEREIPNLEDQRKEFQARRAREGAKFAKVDEGPARRQMRELKVAPAWWLAAPLSTHTGARTAAKSEKREEHHA